MDEGDWCGRNYDFPQSMIRHVWGGSERKMRLFACHCCRHVWDELGELNRTAVEVAEQFADDTATLAELRAARLTLAGSDEPGVLGWHASGPGASQAAEQVGGGRYGSIPSAVQATILRDIFGNPFRPVIFSPEWRTDTAVSLARGMYASRDFGAMPILADALQDAGCDRDDILDHCRDPKAGGGSGEPAGGSSAQGVHVRGCWVVDLVLGKE